MKIYATRQLNAIEDFVGTNLWVRIIDNAYNKEAYIRFRDISSWDYKNLTWAYSYIDAKYIDNIFNQNLNIHEFERSNSIITTTWEGVTLMGLYYAKRNYELKYPIDTLSDEDIIDIINRGKERFNYDSI